MSQHDYDIANAAGASFRADINLALGAISTMNSGTAAPSTLIANLLWVDTTNNLVKKRNNANGAWQTFASKDFDVWLLGDGAVGAPAYSFSGDTDSGMYRIGANNIGVGVNGAKVLDVSATGLDVTGRVTATTKIMAGTTTDGAGSGIGAQMTVAATGSVIGAALKTDSSAYFPVYAWNAATSGDNMFTRFDTEAGGTLRGSIDYNRAGGLVRYNTSSNPKLKNIFGAADVAVSRAIVMGTEVIRYEWKDNPGREQIGVSAAQVYESGFRGAVSFDADGDPAGVDKTAWTFHMLAMIKDHEQRLQALETA